MFLHQHTHFPSLNVLAHSGLYRRTCSDRRADLTHQLSDAATETISRFLVRAVPLIYGATLGELAEHLFFGLTLGLVASAALDLRLKKKSAIRPWVQPLLSRFCPVLRMTATKLIARLARWGLPLPRFLRSNSSDLASENKPA